MHGNTDLNLRTFIAYVPTLGARAGHVPEAAALVTGGNATHYWEESGIIGRLYERTLDIDGTYAWDVWLAYKPGALWEGEYPPKPDFAMTQLGSERARAVMQRLDSGTFAEVVARYLAELKEP